jgi:hypothetical protein
MVQSVADIPSDVRIIFNSATHLAEKSPEFKYGWCKTDHKKGISLAAVHRKTDYTQDEPFASFLKDSLEKIGLPFPKQEEIFRGTNHDLLFLNSHGVVIRIGPLNVSELMNPAILQPLGWFESREKLINSFPFTVAVYPGIELYSDYMQDKKAPEIAANLRRFLKATGQEDNDSGDYNHGIIRVWDEDQCKQAAVQVIIDADNQYIHTEWEAWDERFKVFEQSKAEEANTGDAVAKTISKVFNAAKQVKWYQKAFEVHEPLRRLFWKAFEGKGPGEMPDAGCIKNFWDTCARVTNNSATCVMPVWKAVDKFGHTDFIREEVYMPHVVLYRPWTGEAADKIIQPVALSDELKKAAQEAHEREFSFSGLVASCRRIAATACNLLGFK